MQQPKGMQLFTLIAAAEDSKLSKWSVLQELGLPVDASIPMLGFIGRLDYQKGVDLITESFDWLMDQGVQLILLGSGREDLENSLRSALSAVWLLLRGRTLWAGLGWAGLH